MAITIESQAAAALIRHRRTVKPKQFSSRPVSDAIIEEILENANWAPTHGMTEPWRFTVFIGNARDQLAEFLAATYRSITPAGSFKPNKLDGMQQNVRAAPAVIAVGMARQKIGKISELDEIMAVACAVQNMHLSAAAHGLGGFWSTNATVISDQMRNHVGLSEKDRALGLFYLGYPASDWPTSERRPIADKVTWVR